MPTGKIGNTEKLAVVGEAELTGNVRRTGSSAMVLFELILGIKNSEFMYTANYKW